MEDFDWFAFLFVMGVVAVISLLFLLVFFKLGSVTTFCDNVTEKWIKYHGEDAKYLVSTQGHGVLENTDELLVWKWDSSDFYARIQDGECYCFTTMGWRIPFLTWYQNIIKLENCEGELV